MVQSRKLIGEIGLKQKEKKKLHVFRLLLFALIFGVVKLSGFSSALLLSSICSLSDYGKFEYALAAGLILAIPLNIGLQGAYPYFNLRLKKKGFRSIFYFHSIAICSFFLVVLILDLAFFQALNEKHRIAVLLGVIFSMQILLSSILKSHGSMFRAVVMDGGVFLAINCLILYGVFFQQAFSFNDLQWVLWSYALCLYLVNVFWWRRFKADFSKIKYMVAIRYGRHLVLSSFLIILFTGSARIFIEFFIDMETVGYYAFYLRFATITIMIQQVFLIAFFRKVYQSSPDILDGYFAPFLLVILMISLLLWIIIPILLSDHLQLLRNTIVQFRSLYFILCFHTLAWACLAFNENIIHRENLTSKMNKGLVFIFVLMFSLLFFLNHMGWLNVFYLAMINVLAIYAATEVQFALLAKERDFKMYNSRILMRVVMVLFCISFFVI